MRLAPLFLTSFVEHGRLEEASKAGLLDCLECGVCAYVCPAGRPMVQLLRHGKGLALSNKYRRPPKLVKRA